MQARKQLALAEQAKAAKEQSEARLEESEACILDLRGKLEKQQADLHHLNHSLQSAQSALAQAKEESKQSQETYKTERDQSEASLRGSQAHGEGLQRAIEEQGTRMQRLSHDLESAQDAVLQAKDQGKQSQELYRKELETARNLMLDVGLQRSAATQSAKAASNRIALLEGQVAELEGLNREKKVKMASELEMLELVCKDQDQQIWAIMNEKEDLELQNGVLQDAHCDAQAEMKALQEDRVSFCLTFFVWMIHVFLLMARLLQCTDLLCHLNS